MPEEEVVQLRDQDGLLLVRLNDKIYARPGSKLAQFEKNWTPEGPTELISDYYSDVFDRFENVKAVYISTTWHIFDAGG